MNTNSYHNSDFPKQLNGILYHQHPADQGLNNRYHCDLVQQKARLRRRGQQEQSKSTGIRKVLPKTSTRGVMRCRMTGAKPVVY